MLSKSDKVELWKEMAEQARQNFKQAVNERDHRYNGTLGWEDDAPSGLLTAVDLYTRALTVELSTALSYQECLVALSKAMRELENNPEVGDQYIVSVPFAAETPGYLDMKMVGPFLSREEAREYIANEAGCGIVVRMLRTDEI